MPEINPQEFGALMAMVGGIDSRTERLEVGFEKHSSSQANLCRSHAERIATLETKASILGAIGGAIAGFLSSLLGGR